MLVNQSNSKTIIQCIYYLTDSVRNIGYSVKFYLSYLVHHFFGLSISDAQAASLVVCAVGAGHQLPKGRRAWEPGLKIQLLTGSVVQGPLEM